MRHTKVKLNVCGLNPPLVLLNMLNCRMTPHFEECHMYLNLCNYARLSALIPRKITEFALQPVQNSELIINRPAPNSGEKMDTIWRWEGRVLESLITIGTNCLQIRRLITASFGFIDYMSERKSYFSIRMERIRIRRGEAATLTGETVTV